jgi:hypothetical protein
MSWGVRSVLCTEEYCCSTVLVSRQERIGSMKSDNREVPKRKALALSFRERVRLRAFEIYERRRGFPGSALMDWLRAEWECQLEQARTGG